jgi:hypothetical protein
MQIYDLLHPKAKICLPFKMELLLLVLIIPMIPFYIFSTFLSAGIFMIGIPFIFFAATGAFLRGFFRAIFSRNVFPTLLLWKNRFGEMKRTGKWWKDDDADGPGSTNQPSNQRMEKIYSNSQSPVLSNDQTIGSHQDHVSNFGLNLLDQIPIFVAINQYFFACEKLQEEYHSMLSPRQQFFQELADNVGPNDSFLEESTDELQSDNSSSGNIYSKHILQSDFSLYTAPTHQSLFELAQEISSSSSHNLFEDLVFAAEHSLDKDISPHDSASQVGSETLNSRNNGDRADTTDAAKLLSMFSASYSSPSRAIVS